MADVQTAPTADATTTTATFFTKAIPIPGDRTAVIRKLNWTQLKRAAKAQSSEELAVMREMGADLIKAFRSEKEQDAEAAIERVERIQRAQKRKASSYEQATILLDGVVSIDGQEARLGGGGLNVQDLDPATAEALHEAIVAYAWEVPGKNS
jgi:hypothetical protein